MIILTQIEVCNLSIVIGVALFLVVWEIPKKHFERIT
jgi:hypothetical protein